jgi:hypothetical protein
MHLTNGERLIGNGEQTILNRRKTMSYWNFEKALELAKQCNSYRTVGGEPDEIIEKSEVLLDIKFSKQNKVFYKRLGYLSFYGHEIYGIDPNDLNGVLEGNSVAYALYDRSKYDLPKMWLPIYFFDDGYMGYLDYSQLNNDNEPPVIMAIFDGKKYVITEKIADDLGDFFLQLVEAQLARQ